MYYKVEAKCGHVGRNNYIVKKFALEAESGEQAAEFAREIPRVKHHQKFAILSCEKITYEEYLNIINRNMLDLYFKCHSKQEQNCIQGLEKLIISEEQSVVTKNNKQRIEKVKFIQRKNKNFVNQQKSKINEYLNYGG